MSIHISNEGDRRSSVLAGLRSCPDRKAQDVGNKWVTMPQHEFDARVNALQNFDEEPETPSQLKRYLDLVTMFGIPVGVAFFYVSQGLH